MFDPRFEPPAPAAMSDEQLLDALGGDRPDELGTLQSMQLLERETEIRLQDRANFEAWVQRMLQDDSEQARAALARFAPDVSVPPTLTPASQVSLDDHFAPSDAQLQSLAMAASEESTEAQPTKASAITGLARALIDFATSNDRAKPSSQFWAWFGISGTVIPILIAALFAKLGFSFGQNAAALALGFIGSAVIVSVGSLAGKRGGLPTSVISRAAFGVRGNLLPSVAVLVSKIFWVIAAALASAALLGGSQSYLPRAEHVLISLPGLDIRWAAYYVAVALVLGGLATAWGGRVLATIQKVGGLFGVGVATALVIAELPRVGSARLDLSEGVSNLEVITAAVLIVACMGLAWVSAGSDFARKLPNSALGVNVVGWALIGLAVVPTAVGIVSAAAFADLGLTESANPLARVTAALPGWTLDLIVPGVAVTLVVWIAMGLYSTNLALESFAVRLRPAVGAGAIALLAWGVAGLGFAFWLEGGIWNNLAGLALGLGVPVAAWSGVFIADILLRRIAYHEVSLRRSYGFYGAINWINITIWSLAIVAGYSMVTVAFFGYRLTGFLTIEPAGEFTANLGLVLAGLIGMVGPLCFGLPRIKRQEREVLEIEARRRDLADILDGNKELGFDE